MNALAIPTAPSSATRRPAPDLGETFARRRPGRRARHRPPASRLRDVGLGRRVGPASGTSRASRFPDRKPRSCNFGVWWDGDLLRETPRRESDFQVELARQYRDELGHRRRTAPPTIPRNRPRVSVQTSSATGEKRSSGGRSTARSCGSTRRRFRRHTVSRRSMHDPIYRLSVAYQNVGYNQPTQTGFYLGDGMAPPPRPVSVTRDSRGGR